MASSFIRRYEWTTQQFDQVNWQLFRSTIYKYSLPKRLFMIKWLNGLLPFQAWMNKFGQSSAGGLEWDSRNTPTSPSLVLIHGMSD
jgi:hypothetical protein